MAEKMTSEQILADVAEAEKLQTEAVNESSQANSKECRAKNAMASAAKKMAAMLASQPRDFVKEFDRAWNDSETVRHLRPRPVKVA
jgi:hypothetical protein